MDDISNETPAVVVSLSDGSSGYQCGFCDGTGVFPETAYDDPNDRSIQACHVCDGKGFIVVAPSSDGVMKCRICGGDGRDWDEGGYFVGGECSVCSGRGFLELSTMLPGVPTVDAWALVHPAIQEVARPRFESGHYADAVEAAFKHFNARVKSSVAASARGDADGSALMELVFSPRNPLVVLSTLDSQSGRDEQLGYMKMFAGAMTGIRNPKAHDNVEVSELRALQLLVVASLFSFKLDEALSSASRSTRRKTSQAELDEVIDFWVALPRGSGYHEEESLRQFLGVFSPDQVKAAMRLAHSRGRGNYFKYMCGVLHNWRREIDEGITPDIPAL